MSECEWRFFEPVYRVDGSVWMPRAGVAACRGVPCAFRPSAWFGWAWQFYDFAPLDPAAGVSMAAEGTFRPCAPDGAATGFEVSWISFGSPDLAADPELRSRLRRLPHRTLPYGRTATSSSGREVLADWSPGRPSYGKP